MDPHVSDKERAFGSRVDRQISSVLLSMMLHHDDGPVTLINKKEGEVQ